MRRLFQPEDFKTQHLEVYRFLTKHFTNTISIEIVSIRKCNIFDNEIFFIVTQLR